jgi:sugar/nucleoside kinase (ribokinase family)
VAVQGDDLHVVGAHPQGPVVDTTGAGDQFAAGAVFGLTNGYDITTCARLGSIAAGEVISHFGPRPQADLQQLVKPLL